MSDDVTRDQDVGETPEDKAREELEVAEQIEKTVGEPTSIEEEMLEEAAALEEIAEGKVSVPHEAPADPVHPALDDPVLATIAADFPAVRWETVDADPASHQNEAHVPADAIVEFAVAARDAGYSTFIDLCAVDYLRRAPRFEVVTHLLDADRPHRLRIRVGADATDPTVPSITGVFPGANFYEREAYDLFGIDFPGHPDLTRILMPDDWDGHPLRKDYAVGSVPVQFKGSHKAV